LFCLDDKVVPRPRHITTAVERRAPFFPANVDLDQCQTETFYFKHPVMSASDAVDGSSTGT
jgi:hypothetical protein